MKPLIKNSTKNKTTLADYLIAASHYLSYGKSTAGRKRILDILPDNIHQRVPLILGSRLEVSLIELYHSEFDSQLAQDSVSSLTWQPLVT